MITLLPTGFCLEVNFSVFALQGDHKAPIKAQFDWLKVQPGAATPLEHTFFRAH